MTFSAWGRQLSHNINDTHLYWNVSGSNSWAHMAVGINNQLPSGQFVYKICFKESKIMETLFM